MPAHLRVAGALIKGLYQLTNSEFFAILGLVSIGEIRLSGRKTVSSADPAYKEDVNFCGVARMFIIIMLAALSLFFYTFFHNDDPGFHSALVFFGAFLCLVTFLVEGSATLQHRIKVGICLVVMGSSGLVHFIS